ncbi:MAG: hypothetical protein ACXU8N_15425 [Telluria sp.]
MRRIPALLITALLCTPPAFAQSVNTLSGASQLMADGSAAVVGGSVQVLAGAGSVVVRSVELSADGAVLVLETIAGGARVSVRVSGEAARGLSLAAGATVEASTIATGTLLVAAGRVIAFLPNEAGKALLYHARVAA